MKTIYIIMHRLLDCNDVGEPDIAVFVCYSKYLADWELASLETGACEHDYYYIVTAEVE